MPGRMQDFLKGVQRIKSPRKRGPGGPALGPVLKRLHRGQRRSQVSLVGGADRIPGGE